MRVSLSLPLQVIAQTKAALADMGINTKALEAAAAASGSAAANKSVARSASTLLVKNLPYGADADELQQLFIGPGRSVLRLVLPPTKTLAVVEFGEPQDARCVGWDRQQRAVCVCAAVQHSGAAGLLAAECVWRRRARCG